MSPAEWILLLAAGAVCGAYALWLYFRREVPVAGRTALALVRTATVLLLVLLLLDPSVPGEASSAAGGGTWALIDRSLSMAAGAEGEPSPWDAAVARAEALRAEGATVAAFGDGIRFLAEDPLLLERPSDEGASRLAPLLARALEAGASEVVVLSDLRLGDAAEVRRFLAQGGMTVRFESSAAAPVNAGIGRLELPLVIEPGEAVEAEVEVHGSEATAARTATIEVREGDRLVATRDVTLPAAGLVETLEIELPAPTGEGAVRWEARVVLPGDVFAADDARAAWAAIDPDEGFLVGVGLTPDWELRFLLPVLAQVTGLEPRGYVRLADGRYLPSGDAAGDAGPVDEAEVRRRVAAAEVLVLQGLGGAEPEWVLEAARLPRAVILPAGPEGARAAGVTVEPARSGEWYVAPELPPSAIAGALGGDGWQGLPPLVRPMAPVSDVGADQPLRLRLGGGVAEAPALVLLSAPEGRRAVALASGFWRWGFREGAPRDAYRRLWAGVAGWLLADHTVAGAAIRPRSRVTPRGERVVWRSPGLQGETVRLELFPEGDAGPQVDTVVTVGEAGAFETPPLPPGIYRYAAVAEAGDDEPSEGVFEVEAHSDDLRIPVAADLPTLEPSDAEGPAAAAVGATRPLRTHPLPYLALLMLLCGEWIGRRRRGLR